MGYVNQCRKCYGRKRRTEWNPETEDLEDAGPCPACTGRGVVKPYRVKITQIGPEFVELGWAELRDKHPQPRFGRPGFCQVCDAQLRGRRTQFCSDRCKLRFGLRIYVGVHWQKRMIGWRDGCSCRHCGEVFESPLRDIGVVPLPMFRKLELDHVIALSFGGDESPENCQLLCYECHKAKTKAERTGAPIPESFRGRSLWG